MTVPAPVEFPPHDDETQRLRQLAHDLRTPLSVICLGLEALKLVRHDEQQFAELLRMMSREGTEPLKTMISSLAEQATRVP